MSKQCPVCETINHSAANHCSKCGAELPDKELSEEDKLRIELFEANATIQGLNKAISELHRYKEMHEESQKMIADLKNQLNEERTQNDQNLNILEEKDRKIKILTTQIEGVKSSRTGWIIILLIVCSVLGVTLITKNQNSTTDTSYDITLGDKNTALESEKVNLEQKITDLETEKQTLNDKILEVAENCPLIIKSLKVGNTDKDGLIETDFGENIYSYNTMYLKPQIDYIGLKDCTVTLYLKLFQNGVLSRGSTSPEGFSTTMDLNVSGNGIASLSGWGSENKGHWSSGNYRYEIWYNNMCLKAENFIIY